MKAVNCEGAEWSTAVHCGKYRGVMVLKVHLLVLVVVKQIKVADLVNIILI